MALSYNLAYQEIISVNPTRRQIFAGKSDSTFWNILQWVISNGLASESWSRFHFVTSTKHQQQNTEQTSASKSRLNFNFKILTKPCAQRLIKNLTLWPLERHCLSEFECHLIPKVVLCSFQRSYEEVSIWKWLLISSPLTAGVGVGNMFSYDYVRTICVFQGSKWAFGPNGVISCTCPTTNGSQKPHYLGKWNLF